MTLKLQASTAAVLSISEGENKNITSEFSGVFKKQDAVRGVDSSIFL